MQVNNPIHRPASERVTRVAVSTLFFVNGATVGSWVMHIPTIQTALGLSEGTLGLALLGVAFGALSAMLVTGPLIARIGSRPMSVAGGLCMCVAPPLLLLSPNLGLLTVALLWLGASNGVMDVSMNAQAVILEQRSPRPIMSSFHGLWSVGGLVGSSLGAALLALGISPVQHVVSVAVVLLITMAIAGRFLLPPAEERAIAAQNSTGQNSEEVEPSPALALPRGPLIGLGLLAFLGLVAEGAVADWSAVYLRNGLAARPEVAALGYSAFALTMATGRLLGDWLVARLGRLRLVRISSALATVGLAAALLVADPVAAIVGFGCVGLGVANLIPVLFSVAGQVRGVSAGTAIASVATLGYFGFLAGPPVIGFVAEATNLAVGLSVVVICTALIGVLAHRAIRSAQSSEAPTRSAPSPLPH